MPSEKWLVDRSRFTTGVQRCQYKRYLEYHSGSRERGIRSRGEDLELWIGLATHSALAEVLLLSKKLAGLPDRGQLREAINRGLESYREQPHFNNILPEHQDFTFQESLHLAESLTWGWSRTMLPKLLEEYEILEVERELLLDLTGDIRLMSRPDFLARRRLDGQVGLHDFKTSNSLGDYTINEYRESVQMATGTLASEAYLGEQVSHYQIHSLVKGGHKKFTKKGGWESPEKRRYSPFCYAKFSSPQPPFSPDTTWDLGGFWLDKEPVWKAELSFRKAEESQAEAWVYALPIEVLYEQFAQIGPYPRPDFLLEKVKKSIIGEESRWKKLLETLGSDPSQDRLDLMIPRSFKCYEYGSRCSVYEACLGSGLGDFTERRPHHAEEAKRGQ